MNDNKSEEIKSYKTETTVTEYVADVDALYKNNCSRLLPSFTTMQNFATEEVWADVKGYEGLYKVSNNGVVVALARETSGYRWSEDRVLIPRKNNEGYTFINLS